MRAVEIIRKPVDPNGRTIQPGETKLRTLIETDRHYGHFTDGYASLCHPLNPATLVWDSGGWRPESRSTEYAV